MMAASARDIPDAACAEEPRNRLVHLVSLSATKLADGLIDPKLVLSWLITALGAPAALAGLLVPVREAGALLPATGDRPAHPRHAQAQVCLGRRKPGGRVSARWPSPSSH